MSASPEGDRSGEDPDRSTRKVEAITEELCGHSFSASAISEINVRLDQGLAEFAGRRLDEACPYLIVDARYERVREAGVIRSQAVLVAIGIGWDGRRSILAVELANRESRSSWRDFLLQLRERGLSGVEFVVSVPSANVAGPGHPDELGVLLQSLADALRRAVRLAGKPQRLKKDFVAAAVSGAEGRASIEFLGLASRSGCDSK